MKERKASGLGVLSAAFFVFGYLAGVGILTLPKALDNTGFNITEDLLLEI